jgi:hypothetical protein
MKLSKQQKLTIMQYLLDNINFDGLGYEQIDSDNVTMLVNTLTSDMGTTKQKHGENHTANYYYIAKLSDHLRGLPSYLSTAFMNYDILQCGVAWGIELSTESQQDDWLEHYWLALANAIHNISSLR